MLHSRSALRNRLLLPEGSWVTVVAPSPRLCPFVHSARTARSRPRSASEAYRGHPQQNQLTGIFSRRLAGEHRSPFFRAAFMFVGRKGCRKARGGAPPLNRLPRLAGEQRSPIFQAALVFVARNGCLKARGGAPPRTGSANVSPNFAPPRSRGASVLFAATGREILPSLALRATRRLPRSYFRPPRSLRQAIRPKPTSPISPRA